MLLYHGSNTDIKEINLSMCRLYKDFGRGFYLTVMKKQAEKMAMRVAKIYGGLPILNVYEINDSFLENKELNIKDFGTTNQYSFHTEKAVHLLKKVKTE